MPLYSLECDSCDHLDEYLQEVKDTDVEVACENCGRPLTRRDNRAYYADRIAIRGDTCAGCSDMSNYFDDGLGEFVKSRTHRAEIMKKKGLTDYAPDPKIQRHMDEQSYILKQAGGKDPAAVIAARAEGATADKKRKALAIKETISKGRKNLGI